MRLSFTSLLVRTCTHDSHMCTCTRTGKRSRLCDSPKSLTRGRRESSRSRHHRCRK